MMSVVVEEVSQKGGMASKQRGRITTGQQHERLEVGQ